MFKTVSTPYKNNTGTGLKVELPVINSSEEIPAANSGGDLRSALDSLQEYLNADGQNHLGLQKLVNQFRRKAE